MEYLNKEEFGELVVKELQEHFTEESGYKIDVTEVQKNNVTLHGLAIRNNENPVAPTMYLEEFYKKYLDGTDVTEVVQNLITIYNEVPKPNISIEDLSDFENIKDKLEIRLVSKEKNQDFLEQGPYRINEVGAEVVYVTLERNSDATMCCRMTNQMLETYGVKEEEIFALAKENSMEKLPLKIQSMKDVLKELMGADFGELMGDDSLEFPEDEVPMYVVSNAEKIVERPFFCIQIL